VEGDLEAAAYESDDAIAGQLCKAVQEFPTYIERHGAFIPHYGERSRNGERVSTGFVESTGHYVVSKRMGKKQQMRWSQRGAHLLLQIRHPGVERGMGGDVPPMVSGVPCPYDACGGLRVPASHRLCCGACCAARLSQSSDSTIRNHRLPSAGLVSVFNVANSNKPTVHLDGRLHEATSRRHAAARDHLPHPG
jgi:hypothetical protein